MFYKLIVTGPAWVLNMVGLNNSNSDIIADSVGQRLEHRATMV